MRSPALAQKTEGGQTDWGAFRNDLQTAFGVTSVLTEDTFGSYHRTAARSPFYGVTAIVMEDFLVYPEEVGPGPPPPWDPLITSRLIGAVQLLADTAYVPVRYQGADIKSDALKSASAEDFAHPLYENRHENDATMHGNYFVSHHLVEHGTQFEGLLLAIDPGETVGWALFRS